ncbi:MAG: hypothetical protein KDC54_14515, partial [Lewinella sp.]|nr:hypothetical protein [Lewinella sp.]
MLRATTLFMLLWSTFALHAQLTCDDQFLLSGSSTYVGDCIQLTPSSTNQQGCTWLDVPIDFTQPFTHNMTMNFGNIDANGADGICLVYQTNGTNVCGEGGGGIGSANIFNSFIVEFDTWDNGASRDDIPNDHAAIDINGDNTSAINGPFDLGNIEDGQDHTVTFRWDPSANYYEVSFDGSIILSGNFDIINNCFGGNTMAFWGYTASTGAATNIHTICPQLAPEVITDAGPDALLPCVGASTTLDGSLSDVGPDFIYEWTTINGNILFGEDSPFPTVDAPGTYILTVTNLTTNCSSTDEVTVSQNVLVADITPPNYLDCYTGIVSLDGSGSSNGPNISYSWSTPDGNIVIENGASAEVDAEGEYTLTVIYDDGQTLCEESTTVNVTMDPDVPMAIADEAILYCNPPTTFIIGAASSQGSHYVYEWITNDGNIVAGAFSLFPEVDQPGYYTLIVTNQVSGCTDMTEVYVADFTTPPNASAEVNGVLDCSTPTVVIDGSFSDQGPEYTYEWGTNGGNIVSGQFTDNITVDAAGFYNLTVTNTTTGCTGETSVQVSEGPGGIVALAGVNEVVTCATTAVTLDGTGSSTGNDITYAWTTTDGALSGPTDGIQAMATAAGTYTLLVSDPVGGCSASVEVTVTDDLAEPQIDAGPSQELDCGVTSVLLAGVDNQAGSTATYQWTTTDGLILSGATTLTPEVGSPGTYVLTATSPENGCTASDEVVVIGDAATPTVVIVADDILDCLTTDMVLDASNSSQGDNFSFTWSTADGTFFGDPNASLTPTVTSPGTYTLMITNTDNDCSGMTSVTVTEDVLAPHLEIVEPDTLDCAHAAQLLDASSSDQGPNFVYNWTLPDNTTTGGPDEDTLLASLPGAYQLVLTNTQNGCTSMTTVMVAQDTMTPQIFLASPDTLNCLNATATLVATT